MAKRIIRTGTTADPTGDSLKNAFTKVNDNFTELYNALGLDAETLNLGAFEFTGSVMTTTDSSTITIDQATTVTSDLTVGGDIVPQTANGGDLGSAAKPWRSLYVSNNTIYIGNTAVGINQLGQLTVAGSQVNSIDRLNSSGDEVVLVGGANPYVTFPAITGGDQLIIQGAEVSSVSGSLALTSQDNLNIIANGSGAVPGGSKSWTFGADGDLNIPGAVRQGNSKLAFNENGGTNVYLTPTTDDSSAVFINTTSVQAYATEAVSIQAGNAAGLGDLELIWANAEVVWIDARDNDAASISPATRPWAGMSSYDAYPVIIAYTAPGGVLPTPSNFPPVANSARQAHIAWQEGLATVEGVSITAGAYGWQFKPTGVLELPGAVQLKVYQNTLERDLYIETPVAGMMVLVGTATQVYDGSAWRTLSYAP